MGERAKTWNPCAKCGAARETHRTAQDGTEYVRCTVEAPGTYEEQRIFRASPSSVKTFGGSLKDVGCKRRWAAKALGGIKKETAAQAFGKRLHDMAERHLLAREVPDQTTPEGRLMVEGIPFLPKRLLNEAEVEGEVSFELGGVQWIGYYDWKEFDTRTIGDHKSSSDPKKWGLTPDQLPEDLQACMYAYGSGWPETKLKWVYYAKGSKTAYAVEATVTREHALGVLEKYVPVAQEMQRWFNEHPDQKSIDELNAIPCDPAACGYVGRNCDFASDCTLINPESLIRNKETPHMANDRIAELRAKIEAKKNGGTVNPPEGAAALEETAKEVANDPGNPAANPDTGKPADVVTTTAAASDVAAPSKPKEPKPAKEKPAAAASAPAAIATDGAFLAFLATLPKGSTVNVHISVQN